MSGIRSLYRGPSLKGYASAASAPIRVDDTTNKVKAVLTGSGTTEVDVLAQYTPASLTANTTITNATHANKLLVVNKVDGLTATLPAATGTGAKYKFVIGTLMTSNSFIVQVASATDYFRGIQFLKDDAAGGAQAFATANTGTLATESDTLTWNRTTTGLTAIGDSVEFTDFATGIWLVESKVNASGTEATPFTAAV